MGTTPSGTPARSAADATALMVPSPPAATNSPPSSCAAWAARSASCTMSARRSGTCQTTSCVCKAGTPSSLARSRSRSAPGRRGTTRWMGPRGWGGRVCSEGVMQKLCNKQEQPHSAQNKSQRPGGPTGPPRHRQARTDCRALHGDKPSRSVQPVATPCACQPAPTAALPADSQALIDPARICLNRSR